MRHYDSRTQNIGTIQELANSMLIQEILKVVINTVKELILNSDTLDQFLQFFGQEYFEPSKNIPVKANLVQDYMRPINALSIFNSQAKVSDLIGFYKDNSESLPYFFTVDDNGSLEGMVSVKDILRNIESLDDFPEDTLVSDLPFYNSNPKVFLASDTMKFIEEVYNEARSVRIYITHMIVINEHRKLVGLIDEPAISKWKLSQNY